MRIEGFCNANVPRSWLRGVFSACLAACSVETAAAYDNPFTSFYYTDSDGSCHERFQPTVPLCVETCWQFDHPQESFYPMTCFQISGRAYRAVDPGPLELTFGDDWYLYVISSYWRLHQRKYNFGSMIPEFLRPPWPTADGFPAPAVNADAIASTASCRWFCDATAALPAAYPSSWWIIATISPSAQGRK